MLLYISKTSNPYFNIAAEEYFFKQFGEDFFILYINEPSVIVGKHQNTIAEINVNYVMNQNLKVVRRLSGGGTVFHDFGNLNFCFIRKGKEGHLVDFKKYTRPIIDLLQSEGVNAWLRGKSDLVIDDMKFSGNAEHVYRNKILHHGTLLFNSKLNALNESIKADWNKFQDKAVRSNRSTVTNILPHLREKISLTQFQEKLVWFIKNQQPDIREYYLSVQDKLAIDQLVIEKYSTWDWNFGYSPLYEFSQEKKHKNGSIKTWLKVKKGIIHDARVICIDDENKHQELGEWFIHQPHDYSKLKTLIETQLIDRIPVTPQLLLSAMF